MKSIFLLSCFCLLFMASELFCQPDTIKGGYRKCEVFTNNYKDGKVDTESRRKIQIKHYNDNGKIIERINFVFDSIIDSNRTTYEYENGYLIKENWYNDFFSLSYIKKYYDYGFGKSGSISIYHPEKPQLGFYCIVSFDKNHHITEEKWWNNAMLAARSDDSFEILKKMSGDKAWIIPNNYKYNYDEKLQLIEKWEYTISDQLLTKYDYIYNNYGLLNEEYIYDSQNDLIKKDIYKHDEFGNTIEIVWYNTLNKPIKKIEYIYSK